MRHSLVQNVAVRVTDRRKSSNWSDLATKALAPASRQSATTDSRCSPLRITTGIVRRRGSDRRRRNTSRPDMSGRWKSRNISRGP